MTATSANTLTGPVERVLALLPDAKRAGRGWEARCPAHDDKHPSLSITQGDNGGALVCCHAGCTVEAIAAALGLKVADLFPPKTTAGTGKMGRIVASYDYRDPAGKLLYQVCRFEPKDFRQRRPDGKGGWDWRLNGTPRVLYRLPELLAAGKDAWTFIVEGEKDVDNLRAIGPVATCNPMGAGKWKHLADDSALHGRKVCIVADDDGPGREHAQDVAARLNGKAAVVKVIELPGGGKDASDWLESMDSREPEELLAALVDLAESAPAWTPTAATAGTSATSATDRPMTDSGNAELLADLFGDRLRYQHPRKHWLVWGGHYWRDDADGEVGRMALAVARERQRRADQLEDRGEREDAFVFGCRSESRQRLEALIGLAQNVRPIADAGLGWDDKPTLLACSNGVVNLQTGELRPGQPDDRITLAVPHAFDPNATCPRWLAFLEEVLPDRPVREFSGRALGYSLTGLTREQCFYILTGKGANGKTTLLGGVGHVLGPLAGNTPFSTFIKNGKPTQTNDLAALVGRRFITASETTDNAVFDEARIKALTGQDDLTARFHYAEFFSFKPTCKLWLGTNHAPVVHDGSYAFWRRCRVVEFPRQFGPEDLDPDLPDKLRAEAVGILAWLIRQAGDYLRDGLPVPDGVKLAVEGYRASNDPLADFISECCILSDAASTFSADIYTRYVQWAEGRKLQQRETLTQTMFGRRMGERFDKHRPDNTKVAYLGVRLC